VAPLESGVATFQGSPQQRKKHSNRTRIDERQHESGLFRFQTGPQMKEKLPGVTASSAWTTCEALK
jgi:hypothetical protein